MTTQNDILKPLIAHFYQWEKVQPDKVFLRQPKGDTWHTLTYAEAGQEARKIETGQLLFFAKAIGETNPIYIDEKAAKAVGYPALPAPPTYGFSLSNAQTDTFSYAKEMGIRLEVLLHGEEKFEYLQPILVGDAITFQRRVLDIYEKKGGQLEFLKMATTMRNQRQELVGTMQTTFVVRREVDGKKLDK